MNELIFWYGMYNMTLLALFFFLLYLNDTKKRSMECILANDRLVFYNLDDLEKEALRRLR